MCAPEDASVTEVIGVDLGGTKVAVGPAADRELCDSCDRADGAARATEALIDQFVSDDRVGAAATS